MAEGVEGRIENLDYPALTVAEVTRTGSRDQAVRAASGRSHATYSPANAPAKDRHDGARHPAQGNRGSGRSSSSCRRHTAGHCRSLRRRRPLREIAPVPSRRHPLQRLVVGRALPDAERRPSALAQQKGAETAGDADLRLLQRPFHAGLPAPQRNPLRFGAITSTQHGRPPPHETKLVENPHVTLRHLMNINFWGNFDGSLGSDASRLDEGPFGRSILGS